MVEDKRVRYEIRRSPVGDAKFSEAAAELGQRLQRLRKSRQLTQERAAEIIGIHVVTLREIEHGRMNVTLATLCAICMAYDVELHRLFPRKRKRRQP